MFCVCILMTFLIAVVTRSYERWTLKQEAQGFRLRAHMIEERESIMSDSELANEKLFPKYILLRKPVTGNMELQEEADNFSVVNEINCNTA